MIDLLNLARPCEYKSTRHEFFRISGLTLALRHCGFKKNSIGKEYYMSFNKSKYELFPVQKKQGVYKLYKNACFICNISSARKLKTAIDLLTETRGV